MASPTTEAGIATTPTVAGDRFRFGRLEFAPTTRIGAMTRLRAWFDQPDRPGMMVGFVNPHVYNQAGAHSTVAEFLEDCDLVCVDGVGVTLASRVMYNASLPRVVATDLFDDLVAGFDRPLDALLVGTTAGEVAAAAARINQQSAGLRIVDTADGFRDLNEYDTLFCRHAAIDAVLVGAGTPRSEQILLHAQRICRRALAVHVGAGTIKVYAGTKRRAPRIVSRMGLEWMHRFVFEPHTRRRYLSGGWTFAKGIMHDRNGGGWI